MNGGSPLTYNDIITLPTEIAATICDSGLLI